MALQFFLTKYKPSCKFYGNYYVSTMLFIMKYKKLWASRTSPSPTTWDHLKPIGDSNHTGCLLDVIFHLLAIVHVFPPTSYQHSVHLSMMDINTKHCPTSSLSSAPFLQLAGSPHLALSTCSSFFLRKHCFAQVRLPTVLTLPGTSQRRCHHTCHFPPIPRMFSPFYYFNTTNILRSE